MNDLWSAIDETVPLSGTEIYSFVPDSADDPFSEGNLYVPPLLLTSIPLLSTSYIFIFYIGGTLIISFIMIPLNVLFSLHVLPPGKKKIIIVFNTSYILYSSFQEMEDSEAESEDNHMMAESDNESSDSHDDARMDW